MSQTPAIEASGLYKLYGKTPAIEDVSFSVKQGQIVGFLGPNGAGKSTTMRILVGLMAASAGRAQIEGVCVAKHTHQIKRLVGYMPENNPLPEDVSVLEYLRHRAHLKEIQARHVNKRVKAVMDSCDLSRKAKHKLIKSLSKGYKQRVGIADAILAQPKVVILDEPTIGLDPHQILGMRQLIHQLRGEMTVLLSSHILPEVEAMCDEVIIINQGAVVAQGTAQHLREVFVKEQALRLQVKGAKPEDIASALKPLASIIDMQQVGASAQLVLQASSTDRVLEAIHALMQSNSDWVLESLYEEVPNLEDVFLAATKRSWDIVSKELNV